MELAVQVPVKNADAFFFIPFTYGIKIAHPNGWAILMPATGIEPVRCRHHRILSPARLPVPPRRQFNGQRWIRTTEAICSRFTVCPLWPLGNLPILRSKIVVWKKRCETSLLGWAYFLADEHLPANGTERALLLRWLFYRTNHSPDKVRV